MDGIEGGRRGEVVWDLLVEGWVRVYTWVVFFYLRSGRSERGSDVARRACLWG